MHLLLVVLLALSVVVSASDQASPPRGILFVSTRPPEHEGEEIYIISPDGSGERRLTYSGDGKSSNIPQWSPDGTRIAFASNREDDDGRSSIYVMDSDGANVRRLTPVGSRDYMPIWSPDGTKIAFTSWRDGAEAVYVMDSDGSDSYRPEDEGSGVAFSWSPDGRQLVFSVNILGNQMIYIMDADGSTVRRVGFGWGGGWADESHLWYMDYAASLQNGVPCYGVMDLEGSVVEKWCGPKQNLGLKHVQCLSPDKTQVAFLAIPDGEMPFPGTEEDFKKLELYVGDSDGSNVRRLTINDYYEGHCSW